MTQPPPGPSLDRLDGWKEIAAYMRRSVRTVQRWESQLGLPVHRFGTGQTESLYAIPAELDAWVLRTTSTRRAQTDEPMNGHRADSTDGLASGGPGDPAPDDAPLKSPRAGRPFLLWIGVAIVAMAAVLAAFQLGWPRPLYTPSPGSAGRRSAAEPRTLAVDGRALVFRGADGREVARHQFDDGIEELQTPDELARHTAIADLDGDGKMEIIAAVTKASIQCVFVLNADGTQRMRWRPSRTVRFGQEPPVGPGLIFTSVTPASPADGTFYVTGHVPIEYGSVVVHLDLGGRVLHEYWSNGYIMSFARLPIGGPSRWIVGAVNNETGGGSLAVFDGPPQGSAPAHAEKYRCADCQPGGPAAFIVFPRSRMQRRVGFCAGVTSIQADLSGGALVQVQIGGVAAPADPEVAHYFLGPDLGVRRATVGDGFPGMVDRLIALGWHGVGEADRYRDDADLFPVRRWNAARADFDTLPLPSGAVPPAPVGRPR